MSEEPKAWFVAYVSLPKEIREKSEEVYNVVLIGKHPMEWGAESSRDYKRSFLTVVRFFHEIPMALAEKFLDEEYQTWVSVEDHR